MTLDNALEEEEDVLQVEFYPKSWMHLSLCIYLYLSESIATALRKHIVKEGNDPNHVHRYKYGYLGLQIN